MIALMAATRPARVPWPKAPVWNTPSYNNEGDTTTGWTLTNATLSQPEASVVRVSQSGTAQANASRAVTMPVSGKDWHLICRVRASNLTAHTSRVSIVGAAGVVPRAHIYFGYNTVTSTDAPGTISIRHTTSGSVNTNMVVATSVNYNTDWIEFLLRYDSKWGSIMCAFKQTDGTWKDAGGVAGSYHGTELHLVTNNGGGGGGAWLEFDHITLVAPDIIAIGDSLCKGATLYDPNYAGGLSNEDSTYQRNTKIYLNHRNNYIVNKGVGGNTSVMVNARIAADVVNNQPKLCLLHACNNDVGAVSLAQRTTAIQNSVNALNAAGIVKVLLNASYRTPTTGSNPVYRDFFRGWWRNDRGTVTGITHFINIMVALGDADDYQKPAETQADGVHPTPTGYAKYAQYISNEPVT